MISFQADGAAMTTTALLEEGDVVDNLLRLDSNSHDPEFVNQQLQGAFAVLHKISRRTLELVTQELQLRDLPGRFGGSHAWALCGGPWKDLPQRIFMTGVQLLSAYQLDASWSRHLQHLIAVGEPPLTATLHLQEAHADRGTRFRWIQATTAAELAIKEALLRLEPRLQALLMEVPSPPIHKLYGSVLEAVCGVRSPLIKELQRGTEIRNKLVHRADEQDPSLQETVDYVATVERAIRHLLFVCRTKDSSVSFAQLHPHIRMDDLARDRPISDVGGKN